jgi:hypothetical protein
VPTYAVEDRFWTQYRRLSDHAKAEFAEALDAFVTVLLEHEARAVRGIPRFPKRLGVKPFVGKPGVLEFAWADDGRCTWSYGAPRRPGKYHIIWRRIGTHEIYDEELRT